MKFFRLFLIILSAFALFLVIFGAYLTFFMSYSIWFFLIPLIISLILWGINFKFLNGKAKTVSILLSGILIIIFIIVKNIFILSLEEIDEKIFEITGTEYKNFSKLTDEQCQNFEKLTKMDRE